MPLVRLITCKWYRKGVMNMYEDKFLIYLQEKLIKLQQIYISSPKGTKDKLEKAIKEIEEIITEYKKLADH